MKLKKREGLMFNGCRGFLCGVWTLLIVSTLSAEVHSYRYELALRTGDSRFAGEIGAGKGSIGPRFDVETDAKSRIATITDYQDGNQTRRRVFHFEPEASLPGSLDIFRGDELIAKTRIERNAHGESTRIEYLTILGQRTGDMTCSYSEDHVDWAKHNAEGKGTYRGTNFFSTQGVKIRSMEYMDARTSIETTYDPENGQVLLKKQFFDGEIKVTTRQSYDENGSLIRADLYSGPKDQWYGTSEYQAGLRTRQTYKFTNGTVAETLITYDSKGSANEARFSVNDRFICTFKFDRFPNENLKRTLAVGPNGDVYAEYPDHYVDQVRRDGSPTSEIAGMVIYKRGDWW
jgi:antitoxin component YwqK of YwqJK toxin-antitoxin module